MMEMIMMVHFTKDLSGFIGDVGDDDNGALYQGALIVCHAVEGEREDARLIKSS